jgi:hypothetical protein
MKHIILFLSILFTVQIGTAQETWNACNSTVTVIPAPSYDSTFVLEAPSRAALQKGMANWVPASSGGSASYLVYTALLSQSGTSAPTAVVLENTLGGSISWTYDSEGLYIGTLTGAFTYNKTAVIFNTPLGFTASYRSSINTITILTYDESFTLADDMLNNTFLEVRVYP